MIVGTIVARRDHGRAALLDRSVRATYPDARIVAVELDAGTDGPDPPAGIELLDPRDLLEDGCPLTSLAFANPEKALARALAPVACDALLERGDGPVVLLGADVWLRGDLDDMIRGADESGLAVLKRASSPPPDDGRAPDLDDLERLGVADDGYIAAAPGAAQRDLRWIATQVRLEPDDLRPTPAVDRALAFASHSMVRSARHGLAYWNAHERTLTREGDRWLVNGEDLASVHFAGFDPERPFVLSTDNIRAPRTLLSGDPEIFALSSEYTRSLLQCGHTAYSSLPYRYERLSDGRPVDPIMRRAARAALRAGEQIPFDPFSSPVELVLGWLNEPHRDSRDPRVTRYIRALWENDLGLMNRFPDPGGESSGPFLDWIDAHVSAGGDIPSEMVPPRRRPRPAVSPPTRRGVNLVGYLRAGFGVGEATRLIAEGLAASGLPHAQVNASGVSVEHEAEFAQRENEPDYDVNLICVNVDWMERFARSVGTEFFDGRRNIGVWWWESDLLPEPLARCDAYFDEIWVGSEYIRAIVAGHTDRPVRVLPVPAPQPPAGDLPSRADLGLPDGFLFLSMFDFNSTVERKNPDGVIRAFIKAFADGEGPTLVVKSVNGHLHVPELERLRLLVRDRTDVMIVDEYLPRAARDGYLMASDCYVSLHRSEGLGLPIAEAMTLGKPAVATAFSGSLEFMTEENSYLVPHRPYVLQRRSGPYPAGTGWADPDLDAAATVLRRIYEDPSAAAQRGLRGQAYVRDRLSVERSAAFIRDWIGSLPPPDPNDTSRHGSLPLPQPAREAIRFVQQGPAPVTLDSSKGWAGRTAKRAVLAATRPTRVVQAEFNASIAAGLEQAVHATSSRLDDIAERDAALRARVAELEGRMRVMEERTAVDLADLRRRLSPLETLDEKLHAKPFMADPAALMTFDDEGRPAIGSRIGDRPEAGPHLYRGFEDVFRGDEARIGALQKPYLTMLAANGPVLDIGCGRGEMLDLLRDAGVDATGVDMDRGMVERCREKGHRVREGDAVSFLRRCATGSFGSVFSAQVIEHLEYEDLLALLSEARRVVRPGGRVVLETVNPHAIQAFKAFWLDLTHVRPIFPEVAVVLALLSGFSEAWIMFPGGHGEVERDRREEPAYSVIAVVGTSPTHETPVSSK